MISDSSFLFLFRSQAEERFTQVYSSADGMSFRSFKDFSVNNEFKRGAEEFPLGGGTTFLEQTKRDVASLRDILAQILNILGV